MDASPVAELRPLPERKVVVVVSTLRGPVGPESLGRVLMHEHVFVVGEELRRNSLTPWDERHRVEDAVAKLRELRAAGVETIVDPTVIGLGRYLPRLREVNDRVDLNIVPATGVYTYDDVPLQFRFRGPGLMFDVAEPMTELFVAELTEGIADTGVKAAFLKCAIDSPGLTPGVERVMRAVAAAHRRTGAPITVHTHPRNGSGRTAMRLLRSEDVDLTKVVLGHSGDTTDLDYLTELADAGCLLGMDRFGLDAVLGFEQRVDTVVRLVRRGYATSVVLSHDTSCFIDWFDERELERAAPNWHYLHISREVLPALRAGGVTEEQIQTMLVDNPRKYFAEAP